MTSKELIKLLIKNGYLFIRQKGSHAIFRHPSKRQVIVPIHNRDIPTGTLKSILKDAGLK